MRYAKPLLALTLAAGGLAGVASAQRAGELATDTSPAIPSDAPFALDPPERWACDRIAPAYRAYLRDGGDPAQWRFAGKAYRTPAGDRRYTWSDWLDWYDRTCDATIAARDSSGRDLTIVGGVIGVGAAILLLGAGDSGGSAGADSPG